MAATPRPAILTALAVLNLAFAIGAVVSALDWLVESHAPGSLVTSSGMSFVYPNRAAQLGFGVAGLVRVVMQVTAGIGYLRMHAGLGRMLGTVWAIMTLCMTLAASVVLHAQGTAFYLVLGAAYPIATLYILNVSHRSAFQKR